MRSWCTKGIRKSVCMKFYAHVGRPRPTRLDFKAVPLKAAHGHFAMLMHSKNHPTGLAPMEPSCWAVFLFFSDFAVLCLVLLNAVPDQNQDLAVGAAALIVRYHMELIQDLFVDANG